MPRDEVVHKVQIIEHRAKREKWGSFQIVMKLSRLGYFW